MAATVTVSILTPAANAEVEDSVSATGTVTVQGGVLKKVNLVNVRFGEGGKLRPATVTLPGQWACTGTVAPDAPAGGPLTISVFANVTIKGVGEDDVIDGDGSVAVQLKPTPPELTIEAYPSPVTPPTVPYAFAFRGTAHDAASGVAAVLFRIDAGDFAAVDNVSGDWGQWAKTIDLPAGTHQLTVEAADTHGATTAQTRPIVVRRPFTPTEIDQVFAPTTYLRELLDFANRQIAIGDSAAGPTPELLAARFFQPFDRLTAAEAYADAVRPVQRARIATEVLRRRIGAPPPAVEQASRAAAYRAIVRELGTSPDELRLARLADADIRRALAARIGIDAGDQEPAHLGDLTLAPDAVSEDQLRGLFGIAPTPAADPLGAPGADPLVPAWQLGALRSAWQREDAEIRDAPGGALPIIDPDLAPAANLRSRDPANPAFALWAARRSWIAQTAAAIDQQAAAQAEPAARFDGLLTTFVGTIDLAALAARDRAGEDIADPLASLDLDLDAFRFLVMCRAALAAGVALDAEWRDVAAIALQVQKRRRYPQWRAEERQAGLVLDPRWFNLGAVGQDGLPAWRASPRAVADWRQTLGARAAQERDVEGAYRAALDATEAQTMHALRDAYITTIGQQQAAPKISLPRRSACRASNSSICARTPARSRRGPTRR